MNTTKIISKESGIKESWVENVIDLLEKGSTIPFIARYRKEMTDSMDEVKISQIRDIKEQLKALSDRKTAILKSLKERDLFTEGLAAKIKDAPSLSVLEDIYEKYRPKKRTRALIAKEKGLEGLAILLLNQSQLDPQMAAKKYIDIEKKVNNVEDALSGARDIVAEMISEDANLRASIRRLFLDTAVIASKVKKSRKEEGLKYKDYFDWQEPAFKTPSHRLLAMFRGKNESILSIRILPDEKAACNLIENRVVKNSSLAAKQIALAVKDSYKRLLSKSIETECFKKLKENADIKAVQVFADNTKALLLSPPLGQHRVLAIDPGFRTGCKVVCLNRQGQLLHHDVIYPHVADSAKAKQKIQTLVGKYKIEAIAIGNGTAGRETQGFISELGLESGIQIVMVDESGASIYSASKIARDEFPDHDITVRGAVSIGRRLMDPLAELVKLDPKSIGVGQYQHDVDPGLLATSLDDGVVFCVNQVGVEANTASKELLSYVAGLNKTIAQNMVIFRDENGPFKNRKAFLKVPRLGPKAFEQAAGFLRIHDAGYPLDSSGVHPEAYKIVEKMAKDVGVSLNDLMQNKQKVTALDLQKYMTQTIGLPTLKDIQKELLSPGRDPRKQFENIAFDDAVHEIKDLIVGMKLPGIVTNVTAFGAFVDIGVHQDGLVHISQLADRFIKDPNQIVTVRQKVLVTVLDVDIKRKRISLSMK
ncbi:MAG: RNA-binding transcriptional accessory protein [Desulfobacula sp.]|nr:RNA-binding transcriptional accessory protein [Desulfobacula sp.]